MSADLPPLDSCGFVRVPSDDRQQLWMTCESCGKSDHFWLDDGVRCRCGARFAVAVRPDGSQVPAADLEWVPFKKGPVQLGSWEWDPLRIAILVAVVSGTTAAVVAWLW